MLPEVRTGNFLSGPEALNEAGVLLDRRAERERERDREREREYTINLIATKLIFVSNYGLLVQQFSIFFDLIFSNSCKCSL